MSPNYVNDLYKLLETDDESIKSDVLYKLSKIDRKGLILDPKHLVYCLLYSNESIVECKILSLLSFLTIQHVDFKQALSNMTVIYHYSLTILSSGCCIKISKVLRLLTALSYQTASLKEHQDSTKSFEDGSEDAFRMRSSSDDGSHLVAKETIRTSGCLNQMCLLFIRIDNKNTVWSLLCDCLIECCSDHPANQDHSSHILPKCLRELSDTTEGVEVEVINLVIALTKHNTHNCDKFLHLGGMHCIYKHLLQIPEGVELLYALLESSKLTVEHAAKFNILNQLDTKITTHSHQKKNSMQDLKLLHWITRTVFRFGNGDNVVTGQSTNETKLNNQQCINVEVKNGDDFIIPNKRPYYNCTEKDESMKRNKKDKKKLKIHAIDKKKNVVSNKPLTDSSFRSKYDAISSAYTLDTTIKTIYNGRMLSIRNNNTAKDLSTATMNSSKLRFKENSRLKENGKDLSLNFTKQFTPKYFSTPYNKSKNLSQRNAQDENYKLIANKLQLRSKNKNDMLKVRDAFNKSFLIKNTKSGKDFDVNPKNCENFGVDLKNGQHFDDKDRYKKEMLEVRDAFNKSFVITNPKSDQNFGIGLKNVQNFDDKDQYKNGMLKVRDAFNKSFVIKDAKNGQNFGVNPKNGQNFGVGLKNGQNVDDDNDHTPIFSTSFKVRQFVGQVLEHYNINSGGNNNYENQNYMCYVNPSDFVTKKNDKKTHLMDLIREKERNEEVCKEIPVVNINTMLSFINADDGVMNKGKTNIVGEIVRVDDNLNKENNDGNQENVNNDDFELMEIIDDINHHEGVENGSYFDPRKVVDDIVVNPAVKNVNKDFNDNLDVIEKGGKKNSVKVNLIDRFNGNSKKDRTEVERVQKEGTVENEGLGFFDKKNEEKIFNFENLFNRSIRTVPNEDANSNKHILFHNVTETKIKTANKVNFWIPLNVTTKEKDKFVKLNDVIDNINKNNVINGSKHVAGNVVNNVVKVNGYERHNVTVSIKNKVSGENKCQDKNVTGDMENNVLKENRFENHNVTGSIERNIVGEKVHEDKNVTGSIVNNVVQENGFVNYNVITDNIENNVVGDNEYEAKNVTGNVGNIDVKGNENENNSVVGNNFVNGNNSVTGNVENNVKKLIGCEKYNVTVSKEKNSVGLEKSNMADIENHSSSKCCRRKCKELENLIRQLRRGISIYGLNFQKISKKLWPEDTSINAQYLYRVFCTYIVRK